MNEPTQNREEMHNSSKAVINDRTGLFIAVIALVVGCLGIGIGLASLIVTDNAVNRATISENHWRNFEVEQKADKAEIARLKNDLEGLRNANRSERR
jgi:hypothetical protein